jgi:hypothetical protein
MKTSLSHSWNVEKLALMTRAEVEALRANAVRLNAPDLIELCDLDLAERRPKNTRTHRAQADHSEIDIVTGYHFVCGDNLGVKDVGDGRFWSGSWVVAEDNVRKSIKYGAYLALHESKSERSYRQGKISDYRRTSRGMVSKMEDGIEFFVQATNESYDWVGAGAGEKGYRWTKIVTNPQDSTSNKAFES